MCINGKRCTHFSWSHAACGVREMPPSLECDCPWSLAMTWAQARSVSSFC